MTKVRLFRADPQGLVELPTSARTLREATLALPQGAYTTMRTYGGDRFLRLEAHLDRLERSARLLGYNGPLDRQEARRALAAAVARAGFPESRLRLIWTFARPHQLYVAIEPFAPYPSSLYEEGVACTTVPLQRQHPRAKTTAFIAPSRRVYEQLPPGIHEALRVGPAGELLEGLTSNFFALREGVLYTAGAQVLEGITRAIVLELARPLLPVRLRPIRREELDTLDEAFITSSSREVMPVVRIDDTPIGEGKPGPVTQELLARYRRLVEREARPALP